MLKRSFLFLILGCLSCVWCWAADDPFVGKWKLDASKSQIIDQMKVADAGANKYTFIFEGTDSETIVADGTDQPGLSGTTFSVTIQDPRTWKVVRKSDGHILITAIWNLSEDGSTLRDAFTYSPPNGSTFTVNYVYQRTEGTSGFSGTWESTTQDSISAFEMQIQPYEGSGLSFIIPAQGTTKFVKFDGKDYANPAIAKDFTSSGHRTDERSLEITEKVKGKVSDTRELKLSSDLKTLTMTIHYVGKSKPNILVFDRQ